MSRLKSGYNDTLSSRPTIAKFFRVKFAGELLLINDEMNNVFIKYERYMTNRKQGSAGGAPQAAAGEVQAAADSQAVQQV